MTAPTGCPVTHGHAPEPAPAGDVRAQAEQAATLTAALDDLREEILRMQ